MSLITILIAVVLERLTNAIENLRSFTWLTRVTGMIRARAEGFGLGGTAALVVTLAVPLVIVAVIFHLVGGMLAGIVGLLLGLIVLLFCLGPRDLNRQVDSYLEAGAMKDEDREMKHARELLGEDNVPGDAAERSSAVLQKALSESNPRLFAVLFWFVILGPLGAVLYRLSHLLQAPATEEKPAAAAAEGEQGKEGEDKPQAEPTEDGFRQAAVRLVALLDWIPARLVALGYALTGTFDRAFPVLRSNFTGPLAGMAEQNKRLLRDAGSEAVQLDDVDMKDPLEARSAVERASNLVFRTLIAFVAVLALLTIVGLA
ncbi:regulatory protein AmpE [Ectothiorhodospira haloalkaliphila]|uniref:Regulatory protein AmpE n=1 Tax=Ectothiorhodospira haloalkaliphila TaxID=421628 RepID=W8L578_9GAMM|nr:regulatory signaling modulator protein AmpE [Ectothiorhodospira haloalkaliphila]AHK79045.1 regulatory protein AmpE [Ectothiorhodospira haloalkaliphila]